MKDRWTSLWAAVWIVGLFVPAVGLGLTDHRQDTDSHSAGVLLYQLEKITTGLTWISESDEPIKAIITKRGESLGAPISEANEMLQVQIDQSRDDRVDKDTKWTARYRALADALHSVKNLRAYESPYRDGQTIVVIGGDVGSYFVGIKFVMTET